MNSLKKYNDILTVQDFFMIGKWFYKRFLKKGTRFCYLAPNNLSIKYVLKNTKLKYNFLWLVNTELCKNTGLCLPASSQLLVDDAASLTFFRPLPPTSHLCLSSTHWKMVPNILIYGCLHPELCCDFLLHDPCTSL